MSKGWTRFFKFELGAEGPKFLLDPNAGATTIPQWAAQEHKKLNIVVETAALAREGLPAPDSKQPSAMEQRIRAAHAHKAAELTQLAKDRIERIGTSLRERGTDVSDSGFTAIATDLLGRLDQILTDLKGALPPLMKRKIKAGAALREFNTVNKLQNEPIAKSFAVWLATTAVTAGIEALVNGTLFRQELGYLPGVSYAFSFGGALAAVGVAAGIGYAQLKRRSKARQWAGAIWLGLMGGVGTFFLLGMGHYRDALASNVENASAAATASFWANPFAPLADFSMVPYIVLNLVCVAVVAWKAAPVFGFLDLKRLQMASEKATRRVDALVDGAKDACKESLAIALEDAADIPDRAQENAKLAKAELESAERIARTLPNDIKQVSAYQLACEEEYRETVRAVHPAGDYQPRFDVPPPRLPVVRLTISASYRQAVTGLEARFVTLRAALPGVNQTSYEQADAKLKEIDTVVTEIEAEVRINRGGVENLLRRVR
jgi:hypothetical protein